MAERDGEEIKQDVPGELPAVESPPLSPAGASSEAPVDGEVSVDAKASVDNDEKTLVAAAAAPRSRFQFSRRHQRRATFAVWLALVAGLGALFGGAISNGLAGQGRVATADLAQRKAMQQSIDQLAKQLGELKAKLAASTAATQSQIAKISVRADRLSGADVTGSISTTHVAPVPIPRPAPRIAAASSRPAVVRDWHILRIRGDLIDVKGRSGIYEVVPGAVLPGLGAVQSVEQWDGRWVVVTAKGLIVSARDRGYFKDF
jgi:hypothetical protein